MTVSLAGPHQNAPDGSVICGGPSRPTLQRIKVAISTSHQFRVNRPRSPVPVALPHPSQLPSPARSTTHHPSAHHHSPLIAAARVPYQCQGLRPLGRMQTINSYYRFVPVEVTGLGNRDFPSQYPQKTDQRRSNLAVTGRPRPIGVRCRWADPSFVGAVSGATAVTREPGT